jgi:arylsulfatase
MASITRRTALLGAAALIAGYGTWRGIRPRPAERPRATFSPRYGRRPNILLVLTDQERACHLIPREIDLPHHDRLMAESTVFRNASTVSNLCSLARGVLYSGLHPQQNGLWENTPLPYARGFREDIPTLGTMLQDAGYTTGYFGKWHLTHLGAPGDEPVGRAEIARTFGAFGFEHSDQDDERDGAHAGWKYDPHSARSAARFLHAARSAAKPWFAAVNFVNPHDIMFFKTRERQQETRISRFPDEIREAPEDPLYAKDWGLPLPATFGDATLAGKPTAQREMQKVMRLVLGDIPLDRRDLWARYLDYYYNCLCDMDRSLGVVLDALDSSGQRDDTVVVFLSDHGELAGIHGLREKGGNIYRENQNVPLFVRHPDIANGREIDALASHIDLAPTLLAFAGIGETDRADAYPLLKGVDLSPALTAVGSAIGDGPRAAVLMQWTSLIHLSERTARNFARIQAAEGPRGKLGALDLRELFAGLRNRGHLRGIGDGRYKFARYFSPREHHMPASLAELLAHNDLELYDTATDPAETTNLAADPHAHRATIERLNAQMNARIADEIGADDGSFLPGPSGLWSA